MLKNISPTKIPKNKVIEYPTMYTASVVLAVPSMMFIVVVPIVVVDVVPIF
jgi:hypothetical protein